MEPQQVKQLSSIIRQLACLAMAVYIWPRLMGMLLVKLVLLPDYHLFIELICAGSVDLLPYTEQMRFLPSLIQDSKEEYMAGGLSRQLLAVGYQVLVSQSG